MNTYTRFVVGYLAAIILMVLMGHMTHHAIVVEAWDTNPTVLHGTGWFAFAIAMWSAAVGACGVMVAWAHGKV